MKRHIATVALMLNLGVAGVYAQERPVKMTFSGTAVATQINLQPGTVTDEDHLAGFVARWHSNAPGTPTY